MVVLMLVYLKYTIELEIKQILTNNLNLNHIQRKHWFIY